MTRRASVADLETFVRRGMLAQRAVDAIVRKTTRGKTRRHPEDDLQRTVCAYWAARYPRTWRLTFHSPQGMAARNRKLAAIFKGLGVKPGLPDLICPVPLHGFHGFTLELKADGRRPNAEQRQWMNDLRALGWCAMWANDPRVAGALIDAYHSGAISTWRTDG